VSYAIMTYEAVVLIDVHVRLEVIFRPFMQISPPHMLKHAGHIDHPGVLRISTYLGRSGPSAAPAA
jgi:hypothetical protein